MTIIITWANMATVDRMLYTVFSLLQKTICTVMYLLLSEYACLWHPSVLLQMLQVPPRCSETFRLVCVARPSLLPQVVSFFHVPCCCYVSGLLICFTQNSELLNGEHCLKESRLQFCTGCVLTVTFPSQSLKTRIQLGNLSLYYSASMYCACQ